MLSEVRREQVLKAVQTDRASRVADLALRFGVSEMTIRRDLDELARLGKVSRVHGGAVIESMEPPFTETLVEHAEQKARIGAAAAATVLDGETVIVDIGTTTLQLARALRGRPVTVITNSLAAYDELREDPEVELVLVGGMVRRNYRSLVGFLAEDALRQLHADRAFLGASGLRRDLAVMDSTMNEVPVKRAIIASAERTALLVDSAKFGQGGVARVCGCEELDAVVTDSDASPGMVEALRRASVEVVVA